MTIERVPGTDLEYYLVSYDKNGREYQDPDGLEGSMSARIRRDVAADELTDVFLISHGWKGDVPAARAQYEAWIGAMAASAADVDRVHDRRGGFRPLIIGFHWPSLPWGDESYAGGLSFSVGPGASGGNGEGHSMDGRGSDEGERMEDDGPETDALARHLEAAADAIADTPAARQALDVIFTAALDDIAPDRLPPQVVDAYRRLAAEAGLTGAGPGGAPGDDAEAFDPEAVYQATLDAEDAIFYGDSSIGGGVLGGLRQLSYWKMKKRARALGETSAGSLLRTLQQQAGDGVHFHLMGHSFGCIVVSAAVAGRDGDTPLVRPVDTVFLAQGAVSLWAYCDDIPVAPGSRGYFSSILRDKKVRGALVTTRSEWDTAVGVLYPLASGVAFLAPDAVSFAPEDLPKYGALGAFGMQGPGVDAADDVVGGSDKEYGFAAGGAYNLDGSDVINEGEGASGAHNDIAKPEVGHAFWQAVMAG